MNHPLPVSGVCVRVFIMVKEIWVCMHVSNHRWALYVPGKLHPCSWSEQSACTWAYCTCSCPGKSAACEHSSLCVPLESTQWTVKIRFCRLPVIPCTHNATKKKTTMHGQARIKVWITKYEKSHLKCISTSFLLLTETWILKFGCSWKSPTHANVFNTWQCKTVSCRGPYDTVNVTSDLWQGKKKNKWRDGGGGYAAS